MKFSFDKYLLGSLCLFGSASFLSIAGANVFLGLSTLLFLIVLFKNKGADISWDEEGYFKVITVFAGALFVSALCSANIGHGMKTWTDFFLWRFMPFLIILFLFATKDKVDKLLSAIFCGYFISCLYAIYQGVFVYKLNIAHGRAASFVGHPMTLAGWSCILLPALLIFVFRKDISKKLHLACCTLFVIGCVALVFNSTRGAWLALAIALPLISLPFILKSKKLFMGFAAAVVVLGLVLANNPSFIERVDSINDLNNVSNRSRLVIWDTSLKIFNKHPVLGVGLGNYKNIYQKNIWKRVEREKKILKKLKSFRKLKKSDQIMVIKSPVNLWKIKSFKKLKKQEKSELDKAYSRFRFEYSLSELTHAHNNILHMLVENGLVGFGVYIFTFGFILWKNIKNYFMNKNPYALMIVGSTTALLLQGMTEYNFSNSSVMKIYWFVLACLIVLARFYNKENAEK